MKKILLILLIAFPFMGFAQIKPSHLKAAEDFVNESGMKSSFDDIIKNAIATQSSQVPEDKREKFVEVMGTFMGKYMSFEVLKPQLVNIYAEEFTETDLKEMTKFYATPVGKKLAGKLALLTKKGSDLGIKSVQEHETELQDMMKEAFGEN